MTNMKEFIYVYHVRDDLVVEYGFAFGVKDKAKIPELISFVRLKIDYYTLRQANNREGRLHIVICNHKKVRGY